MFFIQIDQKYTIKQFPWWSYALEQQTNILDKRTWILILIQLLFYLFRKKNDIPLIYICWSFGGETFLKCQMSW